MNPHPHTYFVNMYTRSLPHRVDTANPPPSPHSQGAQYRGRGWGDSGTYSRPIQGEAGGRDSDEDVRVHGGGKATPQQANMGPLRTPRQAKLCLHTQSMIIDNCDRLSQAELPTAHHTAVTAVTVGRSGLSSFPPLTPHETPHHIKHPHYEKTMCTANNMVLCGGQQHGRSACGALPRAHSAPHTHLNFLPPLLTGQPPRSLCHISAPSSSTLLSGILHPSAPPWHCTKATLDVDSWSHGVVVCPKVLRCAFTRYSMVDRERGSSLAHWEHLSRALKCGSVAPPTNPHPTPPTPPPLAGCSIVPLRVVHVAARTYYVCVVGYRSRGHHCLAMEG